MDNEEYESLAIAIKRAVLVGHAAMSKFGESHQQTKCLEEVAELQVAVLQKERKQLANTLIAEEAADVVIITLQVGLAAAGGLESFAAVLHAKLDKLVSAYLES